MIRSLLFFPAVLLLATSAHGQSFDNSAVGSIHGDYFVREVLISGQNANGTISAAKSVIGTVTFDGKGNFSFKGQSAASSSPGTATSVTSTGTYEAAANGFFEMTSLADNLDTCYGGISALGPSAIVASATEGDTAGNNNVDLLIAIPAGANTSNATLKGSYSAGFIDFLNADVTMVREGTFTATADGAGNFGNVPVSGVAANLGGTTTSQTVNGVTYSLSGEGSGSINFGGASSSQLLSGAKNFYISADGNFVLGGSPGGFDLMVGMRSLGAPAANSTFSGVYYTGALEDFLTPASSGVAATHAIDGFYGSTNSNGLGTLITHNRYQSFSQSVFDYTYDSQFTVAASGSFAPSDTTYQFTLGVNGQAFIAIGTGDPVNGTLYSLQAGFGAPKFSGPGVYLNPLGIVNAGNFAPVTNPIAPLEVITLYGTGLAGATVKAPSLPLPTTLGSTQVLINGQAAPLYYVTPTQIAAQVPLTVGPSNNNFYGTVQIVNGGTMSNTVTVYTADSAPGVFSAGGNGVGPAAAQHSNYSLITSASPATIGETVVLYASGLGSVTPSVAAGAAAGSNPVSATDQTIFVDFSGQQETVAFAGLTPGLAGLYQLNTTIVSGTATGSAPLYTNVSTNDGYTSMTQIYVAGGAKGTSAAAGTMMAVRRRPARSRVRREKAQGLRERTR